ncbi:MAG: hypothetical protein A2Y07_11010 [Planctomycetes bacterium GWF2_50_10]|nr:MAG: hypothetical protein A2Y07_11010 [Planctomycetes bacterium GWF2_50_10]
MRFVFTLIFLFFAPLAVFAQPPRDPAQRAAYYSHLFDMNIPGCAWFRREAILACSKIDANACNLKFIPYSQLYSLYAPSYIPEKLDPSLAYRMLTTDLPSIDIGSLPGPNIPAVDFKPLIIDSKLPRDFLASYIPADQHGIFFPSFNSMRLITESLERQSVPLLALFGPSQDNHAKARCDRQLCLEIDTFSKVFGPRIIKTMAFTGSDYYLRTGTDVAVLFHTVTPGPLRNMIISRHENATNARQFTGTINGVFYDAAVSPDRSICSYMAAMGKVLVVSNSLAQLTAIIDVAKRTRPSLARSDEYTFFRQRYPLGSEDEKAFIVVPRQAMLRFAGAKWRIGDARRSQLAAVMADYQARHMYILASGSVRRSTIDANIPLSGKLRLTGNSVASDKFGDLEFMTPIIELDVSSVTKAEADAYSQYIDDFNKKIAPYIAPSAIKISTDDSHTDVDITIAYPFKSAQLPQNLLDIIRTGDESTQVQQTENSLRLRTTGWAVAKYILKPTPAHTLARKSLDNLYILNEWKRLLPHLSPLDVHEKLWHNTLVCPAGGMYIYNSRTREMESTAAGSLAAPRDIQTFTGGIFDAGRIELKINFEPAATRARLIIKHLD